MTKKIPLIEMFGPTIQGEGSMIGIQTHFIRLGLCDFKCKKCDSMHAVDPEIVKKIGTYLTPEELWLEFKEHIKNTASEHVSWITLSGGNPAIHKHLGDFVLLAKNEGFKIAIETQGTLCPSWLAYCNVVTISPKSPGMGESFDFEKLTFMLSFLHKKFISYNIKIVVFTPEDIDFAAAVFCALKDKGFNDNFYLSLGNPYPPSYSLSETGEVVENADNNITHKLLADYKQLSEIIMKDYRLGDVKFLPQLHVLAFGNVQGY